MPFSVIARRLGVLAVSLCALSGIAFGAVPTKRAIVTGNWSDPAIWQPNGVPGPADIVEIGAAANVTFDLPAATIAHLQTEPTAPQAINLVISSGTVLTVTGAVEWGDTAIINGVTLILNANGTLKAGSMQIAGPTGGAISDVRIGQATLDIGGNLTFLGGTPVTRLTFTSNGLLQLGGNFGAGGLFTVVTGSRVEFDGTAGAQTTGANYTFPDVVVSKPVGQIVTTGSGTTIGGDLTINGGGLSDGGAQITTPGSRVLTMFPNTQLAIGSPIIASSPTLPAFSTYVLDPLSEIMFRANATQMIRTEPVYGIIALETGSNASVKSPVDSNAMTILTALKFITSPNIVTFNAATNNTPVTVKDVLGATGVMTMGTGAGDLTVTGTYSNGGTLNAATTDVFYTSGGAAIVKNATYGTLAMIGGGTYAIKGNTTSNFGVNLNGILNLDPGVALQITGDLNVSGGNVINGPTATLALRGFGQVSNSTLLTIAPAVTVTGTRTLNTDISSQNGWTIDNTSFVVNNANFTDSSAAGIAGVGASSQWDQGAGSTAQIAGPFLTVGILNASAAPNVVNYNGPGVQAIRATTYHDLIVSGSGTKSTSAPFTINNDLQVSGTSATLNIGANLSVGRHISIAAGNFINGNSVTITLAGDWMNSGTFNEGTSTVVFNNPSALQTISASTFFHLTTNGAVAQQVLGDLLIKGNANITNLDGASATITVLGDWNSTGWFYGSSSRVLMSNNVAQSMSNAAGAFFDLEFLNGPKTISAANLVTYGDLLIGPGATVNAGTAAINVYGSFINNGTFNAGTSSVKIGNSGGFKQKVNPNALGITSITGTTPITFFNLEIDEFGTVPQSVSMVTVTGTLQLTSGEYVTGTNLLVVAAGGTVNRTSGHVYGNLQQTVSAPGAFVYHMGSVGDYTPVNLSVSAGSGPLTVTTFGVPHPNVSDTAAVLQRYWQLNGAGFTLVAAFSYVDTAVAGTETNYVAGHYTTGWSFPVATYDTTNNFVTINSTPATGTFTIGEATAISGLATQFTITSASASMTAGTTNDLTITARTASGAIATTYAGDQVLTFAGASVAGDGSAPAISDKNGASVAFGAPTTLTFVSGVATVSAGANGSMRLYAAETANIAATAAGMTTPIPLTVTVNPGAMSSLVFAVASPQYNAQPFSGANSIVARDLYFNTATSFDASLDPVTVSISGMSGTISGLGSAGNNVLDQAGDFVAGVANLTSQGIRYDGVAGSGNLIATTASAVSANSNALIINAGNATGIQLLLPGEINTPGTGKSGTPTAQTSGTAFTATINVVDANFNLAAPGGTYTVTMSSSDPAATLPGPIALSGNTTTASITLATAGAQTVSASAVISGVPQSDTSSVTVGAGVVAQFLVEQSGGGAIAPQTAGTPFNIQITAQDAAGNTATSFNGTVDITSNGTLVGSPVTSTTFTAGVLASQSVTINSTQSNTTLTVLSGGGATGTSAPFIVNPAGTGGFIVSAPGGGAIATQTAGVSFNIEIRAVDSLGNPNPGYTGTVSLTTSAGTISPTSVTFASVDLGIKVVTVMVTAAGSAHTITASDATLPAAGASAPFAVVAGPVSTFFITDSAGAPIGNQFVEEPFAIRVTAKDTYGNVATSFNGTVDLTSTGVMNLGGGTTAAFVNGVLSSHTVSFDSAGTFTITATRSGGTESGSSNTFVVGASCLTAFSIVSPPDGVTGIGANVTFAWESVASASYNLYYGVNGATPVLVASTRGTSYAANVGIGTVKWYVEAMSLSCPTIVTPVATFATSTGCNEPAVPIVATPGEITSAESYHVEWTLVAGATSYQIQEAPSSDFVGALSRTVTGNKAAFQHTSDTPIGYYYRVRALADCNGLPGAFSRTVRTVIVPTPPSTQPNPDVTTPLGSDKVIVQHIFIPGEASEGITALENKSFVTTSDRTWMTVSPSSGTIPPSGTTLTVFADPKNLPVGTNTGTVAVTGTNGQPVTTVPVSINIVTPVTGQPKSAASAGALIIPSVGHLSGLNSQWQSDIRITNLSALKQKYLLSFTPSNVDGTQQGKQTQLEIAPGDTTALDDIVKRWYGLGSLGDGANGVLEIRPLGGNAKTAPVELGKVTVASSRTYNVTPSGTLGQYIPAIPYEKFAGQGEGRPTKLSLQQIAQSADYRTNIGLVEASGQPAEVKLTFFDAANKMVFELPVTLKPAEHQQLNNILGANNIALADGRVEIDVLSATGKVTAYASVVDNVTNDPLLVSAQALPAPAADRYVVPGVAAIDTEQAKWRTDMRVFNTSGADQNATLTFYPEGNPAGAVSRQVTMAPGSITQFDDIVKELFGTLNGGGSVAISTATPAALVVTARTYNRTATGTYGQYIPAVTTGEAIGVGSAQGLSILQIEESVRFRTNIGIAEVSGKAATVELTVIDSSLKVAPTMRITLQPNEFRQVNAIAKQLNVGNTYNARVDVRVVGGEGRVTAYGSVVDNVTQDPTYVPAQ